jgi:hypothetical protein
MRKLYYVAALAGLSLLPTIGRAESGIPAQPHQKAVNTANWVNGLGNTSHANFSGVIWGIPDNKILVIEHVSARVLTNPGEKVTVSITCQSSNVISVGFAEHHLPLSFGGQFNGQDRLVGGSPFRCYTSNNMIVSFSRNSTAPVNGISTVEFSFTGYLVDPPK